MKTTCTSPSLINWIRFGSIAVLICIVPLFAEPLNYYVTVREYEDEEHLQPVPLDDYVRLDLIQPDFVTANQIRLAIEDWLGPDLVIVPDNGSVWVQAPRNPTNRVSFLAALLQLEISGN